MAIRLPAFLLLASLSATAQEPAAPLRIAITGYRSIPPSTPKEENPFALIRIPQVQQMLLQLAEGPPLPTPEIERALRGSGTTPAHLVQAGLLQSRKDGYALAFSLLTRKDQARIVERIEPFAESLAQAYLAERLRLQRILSRSPQAGRLPPGALAFFTLGCVSLDWDGLALTSCEGYRATPPKTRFGRYLLWAKEPFEAPAGFRTYEQSTTQQLKEVAYTTFGAFSRPGQSRAAFPELFSETSHDLGKSGLPEPQAAALTDALDGATEAYFNQMGKLLLVLRTPRSPKEVAAAAGQEGPALAASLRMLESLGYLRTNAADSTLEATVPVLTQEDTAWIGELRQSSWKIMRDWFAKHFKEIEAAFPDLSATRHGVPFPVVFDQVFHYVFGRANAKLMASGFYADPEGKAWPHPGFIPGVWDPRLGLWDEEENPCDVLKGLESRSDGGHSPN